MHVITGAPGTGKTAIIEALGADVVTVAEPAREILAEQRATGGAAVPDRDPAAFVALLLQRSIEKYLAYGSAGPTVFDRGIPDCAAYAAAWDLDTAEITTASALHRYTRPILITPPWAAIYSTDEERTMPFEWVQPFHDRIVAAYLTAGYDVVEVPRGPLADRVGFVLGIVTAGGMASS